MPNQQTSSAIENDFMALTMMFNVVANLPQGLLAQASPSPAATGFLTSLPTIGICDLRENDQECHICIQPFANPNHAATEQTEVPLKLPCNHIMGSICLATWFQTNNTCPLCRTTLFHYGQNPVDTETMNALDTEFESLLRLALECSARAIELQDGPQTRGRVTELSQVNERFRSLVMAQQEVGRRIVEAMQRPTVRVEV